MAFSKKTWKDRLVEFPGRRLLTKISGSADGQMVVDVTRNEGEVSQAGDAFSASNMNDLEQRIEDEFEELNNDFEIATRVDPSDPTQAQWRPRESSGEWVNFKKPTTVYNIGDAIGSGSGAYGFVTTATFTIPEELRKDFNIDNVLFSSVIVTRIDIGSKAGSSYPKIEPTKSYDAETGVLTIGKLAGRIGNNNTVHYDYNLTATVVYVN